MKKSLIAILFTGILTISGVSVSSDTSLADPNDAIHTDEHYMLNYVHSLDTDHVVVLYKNDGNNNFSSAKTRSLGAHTGWYTDTWETGANGDKNTYLRVSTNEYVRMSDVFSNMKLMDIQPFPILGVTIQDISKTIISDDNGNQISSSLGNGTSWKADLARYAKGMDTVQYRISKNMWVHGDGAITF